MRPVHMQRVPDEDELLLAEAVDLGGRVIVSTWDAIDEIERFATRHLNSFHGCAWRVDVKDQDGLLVMHILPGARPKVGPRGGSRYHSYRRSTK
jgi:hypothetical protein